ncbi:hypothetical protein TNCV_3306671 [Trichonephila clavipes]|nr:hypothetical protein TNCV_3306671 [Trichonephila clavipes]
MVDTVVQSYKSTYPRGHELVTSFISSSLLVEGIRGAGSQLRNPPRRLTLVQIRRYKSFANSSSVASENPVDKKSKLRAPLPIALVCFEAQCK